MNRQTRRLEAPRRGPAPVGLHPYLDLEARGLTHLFVELATHRAGSQPPMPFEELRDVFDAPYSPYAPEP